MRVVFMGTPDFAEASLRAMIGAGHDICGVLTQPDKPRNRGKQLVCTPVKEYALERDWRFSSRRRSERATTRFRRLRSCVK